MQTLPSHTNQNLDLVYKREQLLGEAIQAHREAVATAPAAVAVACAAGCKKTDDPNDRWAMRRPKVWDEQGG